MINIPFKLMQNRGAPSLGYTWYEYQDILSQ